MKDYKITFAVGQEFIKHFRLYTAKCAILAIQQFTHDIICQNEFDFEEVWDISVEDI